VVNLVRQQVRPLPPRRYCSRCSSHRSCRALPGKCHPLCRRRMMCLHCLHHRIRSGALCLRQVGHTSSCAPPIPSAQFVHMHFARGVKPYAAHRPSGTAPPVCGERAAPQRFSEGAALSSHQLSLSSAQTPPCLQRGRIGEVTLSLVYSTGRCPALSCPVDLTIISVYCPD